MNGHYDALVVGYFRHSKVLLKRAEKGTGQGRLGEEIPDHLELQCQLLDEEETVDGIGNELFGVLGSHCVEFGEFFQLSLNNETI